MSSVIKTSIPLTVLVGLGVQAVAILDEDNLGSNSATALATQQSIKAYQQFLIVITDVDVAQALQ